MVGPSSQRPAPRRRALQAAVAAILLAALASPIVPQATAAPGAICNLQFPATPALAGSSVPASLRQMVTFAVQNPLVAGDQVWITLPAGTLVAGTLVAGDLVVQQNLMPTGGTCALASSNGTPTAPSNLVVVSGVSPQLRLTLASQSLSGNGLGTLWIGTSASGGGKIAFPAAATMAGTLTVQTPPGPATSLNNVVIHPVASASMSSAVVSVPGGGNAVSADGVSFATLTVTLRDAAGTPAYGKTVTVSASPSNRLTILTSPAVTDRAGIATFTLRSVNLQTGGVTLTVTDTTDSVVIPVTPFSPHLNMVTKPAAIHFFNPPTDTAQGIPFAPAIKVGFYQSNGLPYTAAPVTVTLTLSSGASLNAACPGGGRLVNGGGVITANGNPTRETSTTTGAALFPAMTVDTCGRGYTMTASGAGLSTTSYPFLVGKTSPGWMQYKGNPQRTGYAAGTADFSTRTALQTLSAGAGEVTSTPVFVDLNGDAVLDMVTVENRLLTVTATSGATWTPMWSYTIIGSPYSTCTTGTPTTPCALKDPVASVAAAYLNPNSPSTPYVVVKWAAKVDTQAASVTVSGLLILAPGGTVVYGYNYNPAATGYGFEAPAIGPVDSSGIPTIVTQGRQGSGTRMYNFRYTGTGSLVASATVHSSYYSGANGLALAEMSSPTGVSPATRNHAGMEIVALVGMYYLDAQWYRGTVNVCQQNGGSLSCGETFTSTNTANGESPHGVAVADLDGNGAPDVVVNGIADPYATSPTINSQVKGLAVYRGAWSGCTSLTSGGTCRLAFLKSQEGDLMNTPALGEIDAPGQIKIANVQYGGPPPGMTDRQADTGSVMVRSIDGTPALVNDGLWLRPAGESQGGGVLLDVNHDVTQDWPDASSPPADADYSPEFLFGSSDGTLVAADVNGATSSAPPTLGWVEPLPGSPSSPPAVADVTGDCRPEVAMGLKSGLVRIVGGVAATGPLAPSFTAGGPDYTQAATWASANPPAMPGKGLQARLAWNPPTGTNADGGLPVVAYRVYRDTSPSGPFTILAGVWPSGSPPTVANPFVDATVPGEGEYYYKVGAVTCYTLANSATRAGPLTPSALLVSVRYAPAVTNLAGTIVESNAPAYTAPATGPLKTRLSWTASTANLPEPNGCGRAYGYRVYRNTFTPGSHVADIPSRDVPPTTFVFVDAVPTALVPSVLNYKVVPYNCVGEDVAGTTVLAVDATVPLAPANLLVYATSFPPGPVLLEVVWDKSLSSAACGGTDSLEGYEIYRSPTPGAPVGATPMVRIRPDGGPLPPVGPAPWPKPDFRNPYAPAAKTTFVDDGTIPGYPLSVSQQPYTYTVRAVNCVGRGATSTLAVVPIPPLVATLEPAFTETTPLSRVPLTTTVAGGIGPYRCAWSLSPPTATFVAQTGAQSCTWAEFRHGVAGTTYTVNLTVTDSRDPPVSIVRTATIKVVPASYPVVEFSCPPGGRVGEPFVFTDASYDRDGAIVAWLWEFGDGDASAMAYPIHVYDRPGKYTVQLSVTDDDGATTRRTCEVDVTLGDGVPLVVAGDEQYAAPDQGGPGLVGAVADAGPDLIVLERTPVQLEGREVAGQTYSWTQLDGPPVALAGAGTPRPTFMAPRLPSDDSVLLRFRLEVSSGGQDTAQDVAEVVVRTANHPPVAAAGPEVEVSAGAPVVLDASRSWDADGDALTFRWRQAEGASVAPATLSAPLLAFRAPDTPGPLRFEVEASDGRATSVDTVVVWVRPAAAVAAAFTAVPDEAEPGRYTFRTAPGAEKVTWDFGEGSTAEGDEVTHTFRDPGTYDVTMRRVDATGESSVTQPVTIEGAKARPAEAQGANPWLAGGLVVLAVAALVGALALLARRRSK